MSEESNQPLIQGYALGPFETNCYIVSVPPDPECWIIDASFAPQPLIKDLQRRGLSPSRIILTHAHIDHIAGLPEVRRTFPGVPVFIHRAESDWLTNPMLNLSAPYGEPFSTDPPDQLLTGGETLTLGDCAFDIMHTPGHSPGGITLSCPGSRIALVGDTLFAGSIGRFDFPTSNERDLFASIRDKLYTLDDDTRIYPGHGPATTIGREKRSNPYVRA